MTQRPLYVEIITSVSISDYPPDESYIFAITRPRAVSLNYIFYWQDANRIICGGTVSGVVPRKRRISPAGDDVPFAPEKLKRTGNTRGRGCALRIYTSASDKKTEGRLINVVSYYPQLIPLSQFSICESLFRGSLSRRFAPARIYTGAEARGTGPRRGSRERTSGK